jgi:membrane-bound inhibitor of C-type lysozyme
MANVRGESLMTHCKALIILGTAVAAAATSPASAQTFRDYSCADGSRFIVAFYPYDKRAHVQLDGRAMALSKRLSLSGARYVRGDVSLKVAKDGAASLRHARRPVTACSVS